MYKIMKAIPINILLVVLFAFSCGTKTTQTTENAADTSAVAASSAKLEVLYFHSTNRCVTCNAVENNAKKLLEEKYKTELDNGTIKFTSYNVDDEVNKPLAEKYQISFSTLLIVNKAGAEEVKTDFTDIAFQYARTDPEKYAELLTTEIDKNLK